MNILQRCSYAIRVLQHPQNLSKGCPFLFRFSLYSTSYQLNSPEITKLPRTRKSQQPSSSCSSTRSRKVKKQAEASIEWPRPSEIPYQPKAANLVNLIGKIKLPVEFQSFSDGRFRAATVICQEYGEKGFSVPVLFEGDLAHIVACHLKKNDFVSVKGQLTEDPIPFVLAENRGIHVLVQNINFVESVNNSNSVEQDSKRNVKPAVGLDVLVDDADLGDKASGNFGERKIAISTSTDASSGEEIENDVKHMWKELVANPQEWLDIRQESDGGKPMGPAFKNKSNGRVLFISSYLPEWMLKELDTVTFDKEKSLTSPQSAQTMKQGQDNSDLWRHLVRNPNQWLDFREKKSEGLVSPKFPDFKHRESGMSLWLKGVPKWVLPGLENLEFCVPKGKSATKSSKEEVWKSFIENPSVWWDNRVGKRNDKAPDFKHKETGEGLWVNGSPEWVLSKLPPLKQKPTDGAT